MKLHQTFLENMRELLGAEYPDYLEALEHPAQRGLRVNTLKVSREEFAARFPLPLSPCGYSENGFAVEDAMRFGTHPFHHAGLFYMQEPSAMIAASALLPHLGARVLDLCAAPGGKSTQLACALPEDGVLVANEINFSRARILQSNLERMGVRNAIVTCNSPADFAALLPGWFDAVLVDAPCSGEGMFRKEDAAVRDWSPRAVEACAARQAEILDSAAAALRPGGRLVYSTCTLNAIENEQTVLAFAKRRHFTPLPVHEALRRLCRPGFGLPEAIRVFPHTGGGEGHFACLLQKEDAAGVEPPRVKLPYEPVREDKALRGLWNSLAAVPPFGEWRRSGSYFCLVPPQVPFVRGLSVLKAGVTAADDAFGRLLPHHSLAAALRRGEAAAALDLAADAPETAAYLRGETLRTDAGFSGFGIVTVCGFPLGLAKSAGGVLKNHYPKALRNP